MTTQQRLNQIKQQHEQLSRHIMEREVKIDNIISNVEALGVAMDDDMNIDFASAKKELETTINTMEKELETTVTKLEEILNNSGVLSE